MTKKTLEEVTQQLEDLRKEYKKIGDKITRAHKVWEKMTEEANSVHFKDIEWLVRNPEQPGQYQALRDWMRKEYGGEYNGVHASGYTHDGNYKNTEQRFELSLKIYDYNKKDHEDREKLFKSNVRKFVSEVLPLLEYRTTVASRWSDEFPEMKVHPLQYKSESSCLTYLFYQPEEDTWYKGTLTYSRWNVVKKFDSFEEALDHAFQDAQHDEDDY
jgi:hypothetical protein